MRVAVAGAHGQIALRLNYLLSDAGHDVVGLIRNPDHGAEVEASGAAPVVLDLEDASVDDLATAIDGCDAVVFAAGAGPRSGIGRKDTVDRGAAVLLADAAQMAGVRRYLMVSSMGTDSVRGGAAPEGMEEVFVAYLRAKLAAEDDLRSRDLDWTILRPGGLTDDLGTGRVTLAATVQRGKVPRDDVAAVLLAVLDDPSTSGRVLELVGGDVDIRSAVAAL